MPFKIKMERKNVIIHIDDLTPSCIQSTENSVIFFVSSAIYPYCFTPFTPEERLEQTVKTLHSVRKHVPNAIIILCEASREIQQKDIDILSPYLDYTILFAKKNMNLLGKNGGEKFMSFSLARVLNQCKFSKMYKLSGRYYLTDEFSIDNFSDEKITLRRSTWKPERLCMVTVLYSVPRGQYDTYVVALENSLTIPNDIEHSLFQSFPLNSYIEIKKVHASGTIPSKELVHF